MSGLKLSVLASIEGVFEGENDMAAVAATFKNTKRLTEFVTGAGLGQASKVFAARRVIAAGGNDDLDLSAGALNDVFGKAVSFAKVKAIMVFAAPANTNSVVVGGAAAATFNGPFQANTHKHAIPPGGMYLATSPTADGWAVAEGASDVLRIANGAGGTGVTYDIVLIGA